MNPSRFRASLRYTTKPLALVAIAMVLILPIAISQRQKVAWIKLDFFANTTYRGPAGSSATYKRMMIALFLSSGSYAWQAWR